jgi:hypothetical protein
MSAIRLVTGWRGLRHAWRLTICVATVGFSSCGGDSYPSVTTEPGPSPFISLMHVQGINLGSLRAVEYTIEPKPGSASRAVHVEYSLAALQARGYAISATSLTVPVFGLYAGYDNQVLVQLDQTNGTVSLEVSIPTMPYVDPTGIYGQPYIRTPRAARAEGSVLGFDFIYIKSALGSPVIVDTDAQIRWAVPAILNSLSSTLVGDEFVIGDAAEPIVHRVRLDGTVSQGPLPGSFMDFDHDIEAGKTGLMAEVDAPGNIESNVIEMADSSSNTILNQWDLGAILSAYMSSHGDDPTQFVRPGVDWFHSNSAIYDASDNSLIVSSRENFVIKLDYATGAIKWILGDPTKYWYTFPSLRAKALTLAPGGLYPIGQHALSLTSGLLMLFNDGEGSYYEPPNQSAGQTRTYSAVSAYAINEASMTAQEVWDYDAGQTIFSTLCSSAYQTADQSLLVDYAYADSGTMAILVGLNAAHETVFYFEYPTTGCDTSWNAQPLALDNLNIQQ